MYARATILSTECGFDACGQARGPVPRCGTLRRTSPMIRCSAMPYCDTGFKRALCQVNLAVVHAVAGGMSVLTRHVRSSSVRVVVSHLGWTVVSFWG